MARIEKAYALGMWYWEVIDDISGKTLMAGREADDVLAQTAAEQWVSDNLAEPSDAEPSDLNHVIRTAGMLLHHINCIGVEGQALLDGICADRYSMSPPAFDWTAVGVAVHNQDLSHATIAHRMCLCCNFYVPLTNPNIGFVRQGLELSQDVRHVLATLSSLEPSYCETISRGRPSPSGPDIIRAPASTNGTQGIDLSWDIVFYWV